jgi:hypothetical protein
MGITDVYDEMKDGPLAEGRDYGVAGLKDSLKRMCNFPCISFPVFPFAFDS